MVQNVFPKRYRCAEYDLTWVNASILTAIVWCVLQNPNCKVTNLDISCNRVGAYGSERIAAALQVRVMLCVCGLLCSTGSINPTGWSYVQNPNCKLTTLGVSDISIGREGVESIVEALKVQSMGLDVCVCVVVDCLSYIYNWCSLFPTDQPNHQFSGHVQIPHPCRPVPRWHHDDCGPVSPRSLREGRRCDCFIAAGAVAEAHLTVLNSVTSGLDNRDIWICFAECKLRSD